MRILIAEDETALAKGLKYILEKQKYSVDIVSNGKDALEFCHQIDYDAVILDIMMPEINGLNVLRQLRREKSDVPIMMLTAKAEIEDRVEGLESGADDYLPKPFATQEFIARIKALTRRSKGYQGSVLALGHVRLKCSSYELECREKVVRLNNKEYQLLELFFRHPHFVFSTEHLMEKIWGLDSEADINVVWTYVGFIRKKLRELGADIEIKTVRGAGYSLEEIKC